MLKTFVDGSAKFRKILDGNLIALKEALDRSLMHTKSEIDFAMEWLDDQYEESELTLHDSYNKIFSDQYTKTMKQVLGHIIPCWKLINKK